MSKISLTFDSLKQAYLDGAWTVEVLIRHLNEVIESRGEDSVWISRVAKETILERARALDDLSVDEKSVLPLFGQLSAAWVDSLRWLSTQPAQSNLIEKRRRRSEASAQCWGMRFRWGLLWR